MISSAVALELGFPSRGVPATLSAPPEAALGRRNGYDDGSDDLSGPCIPEGVLPTAMHLWWAAAASAPGPLHPCPPPPQAAAGG